MIKEPSMREPKAFYFPSEVVMVDDNQSFVTNFKLYASDHLDVNTFIDPNKAIQKIREN